MQWRLQGKSRAAENLCAQLGVAAVFNNGSTSAAYNTINKALRDEINAACQTRDARISQLETAIRIHQRQSLARGGSEAHDRMLYAELEAY